MAASPADSAKSIAICDTQPVTAEGIRNLLRGVPDLKFLTAPETLAQATEVVRKQHPNVLILDKGFGIQAILDWLTEIQAGDGTPLQTGMVVWGVSVTEAEALRFLQAGARGIPPKIGGGPGGGRLPAHGGGGAKLDGGLCVPRFHPFRPLSAQ